MTTPEKRPDPDFSLAGTPLYVWLGHDLHESVELAAKEGLGLPNEPIIAAVFSEPALAWKPWTGNQRRMLRIWKVEHHADLPGTMRLTTRTVLDPDNSQDKRAVLVTFIPAKKKKAQPDVPAT